MAGPHAAGALTRLLRPAGPGKLRLFRRTGYPFAAGSV
jgi:hypothetical protein